MAHVQIKIGKDTRPNSDVSVTVDGVEMADNILQAGFSVDVGDVAYHRPPTVSFIVVADDGLEIDLPAAVLDALKADGVAG